MESFQPKPFGKYFLVEKLATGGMAEIYKAKTFGVNGFEKLLAIKRILPHCSADGQFITMLIDEAKLSVLLSHTNIVQVYDLGKIKDDYFISMEYIDGINLREVLERAAEMQEKIDEDLAIYIISEICKGLDYAHSKRGLDGAPLNIVHRDISPQNILISFEGEVKIVDFGIAKAAMNMSHTQTGILKGKVTYMSPEQAMAKPIDRKIDIFAAGVMLYEILVGERLFDGNNHFEVLDKIRATRLTQDSFPDSIPLPLRQILAKALAYSPKDRYETAGDFQIDLTRYLYKSYFEFTPRKLARLIRKLFAAEIEAHKLKLAQTPALDSQSQNLMLEASQQENIVHRENSGDVPVVSSTSGTKSMISQNPTGAPIPAPVAAKKSSPVAAIFISALIFVILIALGSFAYFTYFSPSSAKTGTLVLKSQPPGAKVYLDDAETNLVTPTEIKDLPLHESKKITLKLAKFKDWSKTLTLLNGKPFELAPQLDPIVHGSLQLSSTPPNAKIFLNGIPTGKSTPATLEDLKLGESYAVELRLDGYQSGQESIRVTSIDPMKLHKNLEREIQGSLDISSTPPGAQIFLNGRDTGLITPNQVSGLTLGNYQVQLNLSGYRSASENVEISQGAPFSIHKNLEKIVAPRPPAPRRPRGDDGDRPVPYQFRWPPSGSAGDSIHIN